MLQIAVLLAFSLFKRSRTLSVVPILVNITGPALKNRLRITSRDAGLVNNTANPI